MPFQNWLLPSPICDDRFGFGIRSPMTSWGGLLEEAQRVTVVLHHPWLLFSALPVIIVVIAYNFVGDALRDAANPYSS